MMRKYWIALGVFVLFATPKSALAGDFDLDDDTKEDDKPLFVPPPKPPHRTYSLVDCLALADRNAPQVWAARARLGVSHGQLDEARWFPYWQWGAQAATGILPSIGGSVGYTSASPLALNISGVSSGYQPFFNFRIDGTVPLYTFGKIEAGIRMADANVRLNEWDTEKWRQSVRMDVRRAFFGAMFARDARYLAGEVRKRLDEALTKLETKMKTDKSIDEVERYRLLVYREELNARSGEADKGEAYAMAGLRFMTGIQADFDIPDEPLKRPAVPLGPVVSYLAAARLYRPEVNMARAGVQARQAQLDLQRARFFPDIGLVLNASYWLAPSVVPTNNFYTANALNFFGYGFAFGARWSLDFMPNAARVQQVESQVEEARAYERLALGGIAVEVENAYASAVEARHREESWAKVERRSRQWIASAQGAIDLGTKDERALFEPLRVYVNARIQRGWALMDVNVSMSDLARVSGWDAAAPTG